MRATAEGEKTFRMDSLFAQWQEPRTKQAKEVERNGTYECVWAELPPPLESMRKHSMGSV